MISGKGMSSSGMIHGHPMSRRDLFRGASLVAAAGLLRGGVPSWAAAVPALSLGSDLYQSIGVRPLINCKGTFTGSANAQACEVLRLSGDPSILEKAPDLRFREQPPGNASSYGRIDLKSDT